LAARDPGGLLFHSSTFFESAICRQSTCSFGITEHTLLPLQDWLRGEFQIGPSLAVT